MIEEIKCLLIKIVNLFTDDLANWLLSMIAWVIALLPSTPFEFEPLEWGEFGQLIGYWIPITTMIYHFFLLLGFLAIWYSCQHIMRLIKTIK